VNIGGPSTFRETIEARVAASFSCPSGLFKRLAGDIQGFEGRLGNGRLRRSTEKDNRNKLTTSWNKVTGEK
jgi:hypothetical protein